MRHVLLQVFTIVTIMFHTVSIPYSICMSFANVMMIDTSFVYQVIPLVWCLMESKSESAYTAVLLQLRARLRRWNFRTAVSDYEDAIINAVEAVFGIDIQGCYFHYVNVRQVHLKSKFEFDRHLGFHLFFSFLPPGFGFLGKDNFNSCGCYILSSSSPPYSPMLLSSLASTASVAKGNECDLDGGISLGTFHTEHSESFLGICAVGLVTSCQ